MKLMLPRYQETRDWCEIFRNKKIGGIRSSMKEKVLSMAELP